MKPLDKLTYDDCNKLILAKNEEVPLFQDTFFNRFYAISIKKINDETIVVGINGNELIYLSPNEYGAAFIEDTEGVHLSYKLNIANLFLMKGYRLSLFDHEKIYLCKDDGYKYRVNKMLSLSLDGKNVYIQ